MTSSSARHVSSEELFNPLSADYIADPYPYYRRLRDEEPVHRSVLGHWVISRYDDVESILRSGDMSSDLLKARASVSPYLEALRSGVTGRPRTLRDIRPFLLLDPPDHSRLRSLAAPAFSGRSVQALEETIEAQVEELLARLAASSAPDVIDDLARPMPLRVISDLIGVPEEVRAQAGVWSDDLAASIDPEVIQAPEQLERASDAIEGFFGLFRELAKGGAPPGSLMEQLVEAKRAGAMSEDEMLRTCVLLIAAGHETTTSLIGTGVYALLQFPDELEQLVEEPSLAARATDELMRYEPPLQILGRVATTDVELRGQHIEQGDQLLLLLGSANRDDRQFNEPDRLDLDRDDVGRQLGFGLGRHYCLGAGLARLEVQVVLRRLAPLLLDYQLAEKPTYKQGIIVRGLRGLRLARKESSTDAGWQP